MSLARATKLRQWDGARCELCGSAWGAGGLWSLVFDADLEQIVCRRGEGCRRRAQEDARLVVSGRADGRPPGRHAEYRDPETGVWRTLPEIVEMCGDGLSEGTVQRRLQNGWTLADTIAKPLRVPTRNRYESQVIRNAALERAGGQPPKERKSRAQMKDHKTLTTTQKNHRLRESSARALAKSAEHLAREPDKMPKWLRPFIDDSREICQSTIVDALVAYLANELDEAARQLPVT